MHDSGGNDAPIRRAVFRSIRLFLDARARGSGRRNRRSGRGHFAGFLTMEAAETWLLWGQDAHFQQASPLLLGVIAQCIAALLAAALAVLTRAVRSFTRSSAAPKPAKQTNLFRPVLNSLPHRRAVARGGATLRGPPLAA